MRVANPIRWPAAIARFFTARAGLLRFAALLLVLVFAGGSLVFILRPAPPEVVVMPFPEGWPTPKRSWLSRVSVVTPMWFWRVKQALLGPAKAIVLDASVIEIQAAEVSNFAWSKAQLDLRSGSLAGTS